MSGYKRIITFYTTADALETEAVFTENGFRGRLIPIPRSLSAGCGLAWEMVPEEYERIPPELAAQLPEPEESVEIWV